MGHCFNFFDANLLELRHPQLHENLNKQQKVTFYSVTEGRFLVWNFAASKVFPFLMTINEQTNAFGNFATKVTSSERSLNSLVTQ